jgi:hypothetical protein
MQSLSPQERGCPRWLPGALVALCAAQPLLDVLSFWTQGLAWGGKLTLALRLLLFLCVVLTGFVLSGHKRAYWITAAVCAVLYAAHVLACLRANEAFTAANLISDATNFIRVAQIPLFTIAFITFLRCCRQGFASFERGITIAFWIIAAVELLSALTGTNPYTYPDKHIGLCGWFYFANSQSAILSMLVPLTLCPALRSGNIRRWLPVAVVGFAELFCFATRLAYMSLFVTTIGMVITLALTKRGSAKVCAVLLLCAAVCAAGYTVSPMHRNQQAVAANAVRKQENIDRLVAQGKAEFGDQGYAYLTYAYDEYLGGTVERYGLEATAEMYGYSTKAADITNVRTIKINYCRLMLNTEPLTSRLFGLSYDEMTYHGYCYDVENDFHGITYLYGWAGLACLLAFLGYFLVIIVCALIRNARRYFTVEAGACGVALCTALANIYNTAGVLRRPNASFYLCLILASIWCLIYIRDYDDPKEN